MKSPLYLITGFLLLFFYTMPQILAQNVGIGINNPTNKLQIGSVGNIGFAGHDLAIGNGTQIMSFHQTSIHSYWWTNTNFALLSFGGAQGNLRIGSTINNTAKMHVFGTYDYGNTVHAMRISGNNPFIDFSDNQGLVNYGFLRSRNNNTTGGFPIGLEIGVTPPVGEQPQRSISFSTHYAPRMTILHNGNVGIGTTNPAGKLHIHGDDEALRFSGSSPYITFYNGNDYRGYLLQKGAADIELSTTWMNTNGNLILGIKSIPKLTITNNGKVKIGEVDNIINFSSQVMNYLPLIIQNGFFIKRSIAPLDEWGIFPDPTGAFGFLKNGQFIAYFDSDGDWYSYSDIGLKNSIKPYNNVLERVQQLQVLTYKMNNEPNLPHRTLGLIAQEVSSHFPEIARVNKETGYYSIAYAKIGVIAIKAIQEQQAIIENQQQQMDDLKAENKSIMEKLNRLEKLLLKGN